MTIYHAAKPALGRDDQRSSIATAAGMIGALATSDRRLTESFVSGRERP